MRWLGLILASLLLIGCGEKSEEPRTMQSADVKDLVSAIYAGSLERVDGAIARGADINGRCKLGWTPLMHAAFSGNLEVVKRVVEAGAVVDDEAIRAAEDRGNESVITYLKERR